MTDWKNPQDYAYTRTLTGNGWAWEFLRRNLDYQQHFKEVLAWRDQLAEKYGPGNDKWLAQFNDPLAWISLQGEELRAAEQDRFAAPQIWPGAPGTGRMHFEHYYARRWGLAGPLPRPDRVPDTPPRFLPTGAMPFLPTWEDLQSLCYSGEPGDQCPEEICEAIGPLRHAPGVVLLCFDLTQPRSQQIWHTDRILRDLQAKHRRAQLIPDARPGGFRNNPEDLCRLLRVWDAWSAGEHNKAEIWRLVKGDYDGANPTASVTGWLESATELVAGGYRRLAQDGSADLGIE
jgi:hypothetical protein